MNSDNNKRILVALVVMCVLLTAILIITLSLLINRESNDINKSESIDYDLIDEMIKANIEESFNEKVEINNEPIDYERIESIVESKLGEFNKDFGENFEDATSYFGDKIKETYDDISERFKND